METKHTPGPWKVTNFGEKFIHIASENHGAICAIPHEGKAIAEHKANAELIASAPDLLRERDELKRKNFDLLEALKDANNWFTTHFPEHGASWEYGTCATFNKIRSAITKAEGRK